MKKTLLMSVMALSLAACNSTQTVEQAQQFAQCTFPDAPTTEAPAWICDVMPTDLEAGAMGYAKKSAAGMSVMRKVAINEARVQLAAQFQTDVNNLFKQAVQSSVNTTNDVAVENVVETFENVTKNVVTRSLSNSKLIVSQVSPTGGLYVLVGMDKATFQANVDQVVDAASKDAKLWNQFNNEKAAEDLTNALNSLKSM
ncbi:LPP20 family lipoprotein [Vibrio fluvialis]|uniref:LPP20 family lipoprotein n=1 Tax=Vibrio fluvialis TaxID=676 RepID=UPI001C9D30D8|nr:LPP20 family lipoprotein [Vibrio fluvialis]ELV8728296.1 LPP20 family lipoprotein [Vibrio fluvialis]MBY7962631.1 LPP20 family lipoprotein [Vibrio fluvialis]MBY7966838.1 LPP20 family lipoprotein [Vibrio fluvialis]MBY8078420.1 LPP20 family lipoprotein [Vibrio fluvialis]MCE7601270.1 LPP20 family lipoprotein [Vibrio fluvialis]